MGPSLFVWVLVLHFGMKRHGFVVLWDRRGDTYRSVWWAFCFCFATLLMGSGLVCAFCFALGASGCYSVPVCACGS